MSTKTKKPVTPAQLELAGIYFLVRSLNRDGGVPAVKPGDPSGCWTTAEALEAILRSTWPVATFVESVRSMAAFLIECQFAEDNCSRGGWPFVVGAKTASTMATAHSIIALTLARPLLDASQRSACTTTIELGVDWLVRHQDSSSGGWGVEPCSGNAGKEPRVVSTYLALRGLAQTGLSVTSSQHVQRGVAFLWALQESAGFRSAPSARGSDVCSTVRCYLALKETGALETQEDFGTRVLDYVLSRKPADRLWDLDTETYIPDGASGQIIFTQNSTSEILEFLASIGGAYESQLALVSWFQHNQNRDGSWCLGANSHIRREVMTWSTNEVVIALSQFVRAMSVPLELQPPQPATPSLTNARWDLAILCALEDIELKAVLRLPWHWEPYAEFDSTDGSSYYVGRVTNKHGQILRVLAVAAPQMGMPAMAVLAMKVIEHFRPIYLATTGIAAAVKKAPDINFGDVLFAEFSWDYGSGKLTVEKGKASLSPDPRPIPADSDLRKHFVAIKNNASALATIRDDWPGVKPATVLNIHLGPVASGAAVVADEKIVSDILVQHRKLIGIEMEIYGLFYAARHCIAPRPTALAIKSVCDYGDREKSDRYQPYAAYTSARVLDLFVREHLAIE